MKVIGLGIDLVDIAKLRRWIEDPRNPFLPRCFAQSELDEIGAGFDRIERFAGRFAAKEAVLKALGTGFGAGVAFTDVLIRGAPCAPPEVHLAAGAADVASAMGVTEWQLSISHTASVAAASALALGPSAQAWNLDRQGGRRR